MKVNKIRVISGHLTPYERNIVRHFLNEGITEGTVRRKTFRVEGGPRRYSVTVKERMRRWIGEPVKLYTDHSEIEVIGQTNPQQTTLV